MSCTARHGRLGGMQEKALWERLRLCRHERHDLPEEESSSPEDEEEERESCTWGGKVKSGWLTKYYTSNCVNELDLGGTHDS